MNWIAFTNDKIISLKNIPEISITNLREEIIKLYLEGKRVTGFFGVKASNGVKIYALLADDEYSILMLSSAFLKNDEKMFFSLTPDLPAFNLFEREIYEEFEVLPMGHPWLKPVRKVEADYDFFSMQGDDVHEVAVGPVHAGVIEPGHFRFMCSGETIHHLEIQLGYQHRGVEALLENEEDILKKINLIESVCGDSTIGHALAYAHAMESLGSVEVSQKIMTIRGIALELERIGMHIGDLSAISNDIAYLSGNAIFGALRTLVINTSLALCGSRFGRGLVKPGGVNFDIDEDLKKNIKNILTKVSKEVDLIANALFNDAGVLARLEKTGVVDFETAKRMGLTGLAGRASGIKSDIRADHPYGIYKYFPIYQRVLHSGDVFARAYIRFMEIEQSIAYILNLLENFPKDSVLEMPVKNLAKNSLAVSMVEGWRGEIVHVVITDDHGKILRYKIKDTSFNNWFGLALAVRENGISDFPLCNKSFNLSYCGVDL